jgi:hypothetical protein
MHGVCGCCVGKTVDTWISKEVAVLGFGVSLFFSTTCLIVTNKCRRSKVLGEYSSDIYLQKSLLRYSVFVELHKHV